MAPAERKAYVDAVKCMMDHPSHLDPDRYPGAVNRFFDYAAVHINHTLAVHSNGFFLTWHRLFVWRFERDLKDLCGYRGTQPYWNWPATSDNLHESAVFDGSEFSISGDGIYTDSGPVVLSSTFQLPHGSGGGCVQDGPFANMNYTMAPIPISVILEEKPLPATAFDYHATCLTRDLNAYVARTYTNMSLWKEAVAAPDMETLSALLDGAIGEQQIGLHTGAHFTLGPPGSNLFVSPQDPVWYLLHAMLDYTFWLWQQRHPAAAADVWGTETTLNLPPSSNVTLETWAPDVGPFFPSVQVKELINTTAGPFCYAYV